MSRVVLDAGALMALERNDRVLWGVLKRAALRSNDVVVPSTVVAQLWRRRASQAFVARALVHCVIAPFDPLARAVGELCGRAKTNDIADAHVALVSTQSAGTLYTSEPLDMQRLLAHCTGRKPIVVRV